MNDIIDIYDPIYRETNYILPVILIILAAVALLFGLFKLFKYLKNKKAILTPDKLYKNCLTSFTNLTKDKMKISSASFSENINSIFKGYLSGLLNRNFLQLTTPELVDKLEELNIPQIEKVRELFLSNLDSAQFGNCELSENVKDDVIKNCVDSITFLYNKEVSADV